MQKHRNECKFKKEGRRKRFSSSKQKRKIVAKSRALCWILHSTTSLHGCSFGSPTSWYLFPLSLSRKHKKSPTLPGFVLLCVSLCRRGSVFVPFLIYCLSCLEKKKMLPRLRKVKRAENKRGKLLLKMHTSERTDKEMKEPKVCFVTLYIAKTPFLDVESRLFSSHTHQGRQRAKKNFAASGLQIWCNRSPQEKHFLQRPKRAILHQIRCLK